MLAPICARTGRGVHVFCDENRVRRASAEWQASCQVSSGYERCHQFQRNPRWAVRGTGRSALPGNSAATCAPRGLDSVRAPMRTVGTVSLPWLTLRTNCRASSSVQILCQRVGIPRKFRSRVTTCRRCIRAANTARRRLRLPQICSHRGNPLKLRSLPEPLSRVRAAGLQVDRENQMCPQVGRGRHTRDSVVCSEESAAQSWGLAGGGEDVLSVDEEGR